MGRLVDGALAAAALAAFVVAAAAVDADPSIPHAAAGALGTVGFEVVALRYRSAVRRHWERPAVRASALVAAFVVAAAGARAAPSRLLSAGVGALGAYLVVLAAVQVRASRADDRRSEVRP